MSNTLLESVFSAVTLVRYCAVATLTVVLYDYFLTLDKEIRFIWFQKFSFGHIIFLLNRYTPFFSIATICYDVLMERNSSHCKGGISLYMFFSLVGLVTAEATFLLRTDAIWGHHRFVRGWLVAVFLTTSVVCIYITAKHVSLIRAFEIASHPGCIYSFKDTEWAVFIMVLTCDLFAFLLIFAKRQADDILASTALMQAVHRESLKCFCIITVLSIVNLIVQLTVLAVWRDSLIVTEGVLMNMCCSRMLLGIRSASEKGVLCDGNNCGSIDSADHCSSPIYFETGNLAIRDSDYLNDC